MDYSWAKFAKKPTKKHKRLVVSKTTYDEVYKACNGKCVLCGTSQTLELHHILGRGKDLTDNPMNCVMLCRRCHHEVVHQNNKKYRSILQDIRKRL